MYRVEDKYVLSDNELYQLEKRMQVLLPLDHPGAGDNGYKISSLYFDDLTDSCLRDTLDGNPSRDKFRIRIYDDSFSVIKLEVKRKLYNRVFKMSSLITHDELLALVGGEPIEDDNLLNDARTLFNLAIKTRGLRPKVNITYERKAYISEFGNVRITFDRNIRANAQVELFGTAGLEYDYPEGTGTVLEVKYDEFLPCFIAQSLEINNMYQTANSKYGICREIYGNRRNM